MLYVVYSYKNLSGYTENSFQLVNRELPHKYSDLEEIADILIEHHIAINNLTILNWKELDD